LLPRPLDTEHLLIERLNFLHTRLRHLLFALPTLLIPIKRLFIRLLTIIAPMITARPLSLNKPLILTGTLMLHDLDVYDRVHFPVLADVVQGEGFLLDLGVGHHAEGEGGDGVDHADDG